MPKTKCERLSSDSEDIEMGTGYCEMIVMTEAFHPSIYIKDELEAREWSIGDLAKLLPGEYGVNHLALEFYLELGAETPSLRMGPMGPEIGRVFGVDADLFPNLERAWLDHPTTKAAAAKELH